MSKSRFAPRLHLADGKDRRTTKIYEEMGQAPDSGPVADDAPIYSKAELDKILGLSIKEADVTEGSSFEDPECTPRSKSPFPIRQEDKEEDCEDCEFQGNTCIICQLEKQMKSSPAKGYSSQRV